MAKLLLALLTLGVATSALAQPTLEPEAASDEPTVEPAAVEPAAVEPAEVVSLLLARARTADGQTDYETAADAYQRYAERCFAWHTSLLEAGHPCAASDVALRRAFELHRAVGDLARAARNADAFVSHFLYAQPRAAIELGFALVRMHLDHGQPRQAARAIDRFESLHPDPTPAEAIITEALRARVASAMGRHARAARHWREVERRWEAERRELADEDAVAPADVRGAVAEGRLLRTHDSVQRVLAIRGPRPQGRRAVEYWWTYEMSPWLVRTRRRLALARLELERVYELGSPRHSIIAAARIGVMYRHLHRLRSDVSVDDELLRAMILGSDATAGYEQARSHLETCVDWAGHHGVARNWASRCERELNALDPARYPVPSELHGDAAYHPVGVAMPLER